MTLTLRPYQAETDLAALSQIWLEASRLAHSFLGDDRLIQQQKLVEEIYLPQAETTVALLGETPVGFLSLLDHHIGGLFVAPQAQGRGVGRRLIELALTRHARLELNVYTDNPQASAFYHHLGFIERSRRSHDDEGLPFEVAQLELQRESYHRG